MDNISRMVIGMDAHKRSATIGAIGLAAKVFDAGKLLPQSRELIPGEHEGLDRIQRSDSRRAQAIVRQQGQ
jgi:hypothetical protein